MVYSGEIHEQQSRWLLWETEPGTAAHGVAATARLSGEPDIPALKYTLRALVKRHAALRMTFPPGTGPAKRGTMLVKACLREYDGCELDDEQLPKWLEYAAKEPFDLARGPRLRIHVYRTASDETVILVVAHSYIVDVWSMTTLVRELETLYLERAGAGMPAASAEPAHRDKELVRLHRWVGGTRASVHIRQNYVSGGRIAGASRLSVTLTYA
jgi:hypothetical protein